jgi:inner membrane transporter RhtA
VIAVAGALILIDVRWSSDPAGLAWALLNGALFVGYILLGHRLAASGASDGVANLGAAMSMACLIALPVGFREALTAFSSPALLAAAFGIGLCSSVIPYICDQLAMSRLPRASFALLLSLLPATATIIGAIVLAQIPSLRDLFGIALVISGVAIHKPAPEGGAIAARE